MALAYSLIRYCIVTLDNRQHGGQNFRRKTKVIKKNYNPQFLDEQYDLEVKNYVNQVSSARASFTS
eukprot:752546-Hanusia_phi.AAC.7